MKILKSILIIMASSSLFIHCSINKFAVNKVADMLASDKGSTVFTGDEDTQLIGGSLPFALKLYESLVEQVPDNTELLLATSKAFCLYSFAYVQAPAEQLSDNEIDKQLLMKQRSKKLYLRARRYILNAIEVRHSGFTNLLFQDKTEEAIKLCNKKDIGYLYWLGLAWMGAFTADNFDMDLSISHPKAVKMIKKAFEWDETYDNGGIHEFFISYYGSLPVDMGGSEIKARDHFKRALEISKGFKSTPYINLATSVSINNQNSEEFQSLLNQALTVDINQQPENRLLNTINQQKAKWLLDHMDNYFLIEKGETKK